MPIIFFLYYVSNIIFLHLPYPSLLLQSRPFPLPPHPNARHVAMSPRHSNWGSARTCALFKPAFTRPHTPFSRYGSKSLYSYTYFHVVFPPLSALHPPQPNARLAPRHSNWGSAEHVSCSNPRSCVPTRLSPATAQSPFMILAPTSTLSSRSPHSILHVIATGAALSMCLVQTRFPAFPLTFLPLQRTKSLYSCTYFHVVIPPLSAFRIPSSTLQRPPGATS
jgi:hypothetical protein